ncbi:MAG: GNAT family N-acetyltransferase [Anaerolineae bacterium]
MIEVQISPAITNVQMNELFSSAWPNHRERDFSQLLAHSLEYVAAFSESKLIGFVNIAWDGGVHGFIVDTTVHAGFQRQGVGQMLLQEAEKVGKRHELEWLHVDFTPEYESFYRKAGFRPTLAGLIEL